MSCSLVTMKFAVAFAPPLTPTVGMRSLRFWWLALMVCAMATLSACGGGHDRRSTAEPPASVAYGTNQALYVTTEAVTPNTPNVTGGAASTFSVSPALPAGLKLDPQTGIISGTPTAIQAQTTYTVTAGNSGGTAQTQIRIAVTGRGSWAATAPILTGRHYFALVKLPSGKALAIGGYTSGGYTNSVALYDPVSANWTSVAPMLNARSDPSATVLQDGRVLVVGGDGSGLIPTATAEIYDPTANTWTAAGSMAEPRTRHTATLLPDGKLLVIGGFSRPAGSHVFSASAELYSPDTNTWTLQTTPLTTRRAQHAAELLLDGSAVVVIGGVNISGVVTSAELFPVNDSGSTTSVAGTVPSGNVYTSVRLADGSVLAMSDGSTTTVRFHPATTSWTTSTLTSPVRSLPTMTTLADGRVLLAGGGSLNTAEIYNPDDNVWTTATPMLTARWAGSAVLLNDGSVLVVGGLNTSGEVDAAERYIP